MQINQKIRINRYPYTDPRTNKIINPPPIELDSIDVTFVDNATNKTVFAKIKNFPVSVLLFGPRSYDSIDKEKSEEIFINKLVTLLGNDPAKFLQSLLPKTLEINPNGPGSILSGMLSSMGIRSTPTCSCKRRALEMNEKGPEWCEQNLEQIVNWLEEEAKKRKLPFVKTIAKLMVQRAISKSKRLLAQNNNVKT